MSLLTEIQAACVDDKAAVGPILLKLKFLAAKLRSETLEDWVSYENDGYPLTQAVPRYRRLQIVYHGTFSNGFVTWPNMQVPAPIIKQVSSQKWIEHECRESIAEIDELTSKIGEGGSFGLDASSLIVLLNQSKAFNIPCVELRAAFSDASIVGIRHAVRSRILDLTLAIEREVASAGQITLSITPAISERERQIVTNITNKTIYGNSQENYGDVIGAAVAGDASNVNVSIAKGDTVSLVRGLIDAGIPEDDARDFAATIEHDEAGTVAQPFGPRALDWVERNIGKAISGAWKISLSAAEKVLTNAAIAYFGLGR